MVLANRQSRQGYQAMHPEEGERFEPIEERHTKKSTLQRHGPLLFCAFQLVWLVSLVWLAPENSPREALVGNVAVAALNADDNTDVYDRHYKVLVPYVTPHKSQKSRGTCWDFSTIGMMEQSYRAHGVRNGWLKPEEYVRFNEQAYGVSVLAACRLNPQPCLVPQDEVWMNSTEGGEVPMLFYLQDSLQKSLVPSSVCPYITQEDGSDNLCPGLDEAVAKNPIQFRAKSMVNLYEVTAIKERLRKHRRGMGLSTPMTEQSYFFPCVGKWKTMLKACEGLEIDTCTMCPARMGYGAVCCVPEKRVDYNMEGEFYSHGQTFYLEGGHAMMLVGYNDNFVTQDGNIGGFIVKNSWDDAAYHGTGSHSAAYFMQEISRWDEQMICPNGLNPRNWYPCDTMEKCLSAKEARFSDIQAQPMHLKCINATMCNVGEEGKDIVYFVKKYTMGVGDDMVGMCFWKYDTMNDPNQDGSNAVEECYGPYPMDQYSKFFSPLKLVANDMDRCGFFFFPYNLVQQWWAKYHNAFATDIHIEWDESSYLANKHKYPEYDYSWIEKSTHQQNDYNFPGPFPHKPYLNVQRPKLDQAEL